MSLSRIMIFGLPGSGKSTFADLLAKKLDIPVYHLDTFFFIENWVERPYKEFMAMQQDLVAQEKWIIDGNATASLEIRFARAHLVLYFQYPWYSCLWRLFKRRFWSKRTTNDLPEKSKDIITWKLIKYLLTFNARVQSTVSELRKKYPNVRFYRISSDNEREKVMQLLLNQSPL